MGCLWSKSVYDSLNRMLKKERLSMALIPVSGIHVKCHWTPWFKIVWCPTPVCLSCLLLSISLCLRNWSKTNGASPVLGFPAWTWIAPVPKLNTKRTQLGEMEDAKQEGNGQWFLPNGRPVLSAAIGRQMVAKLQKVIHLGAIQNCRVTQTQISHPSAGQSCQRHCV